MRDDFFVRVFRAAHQLVEGRQGAGNFQSLEDAAADLGEKRRFAAGVAGVEQLSLVVDLFAVGGGLPAWRTGSGRFAAEDAAELGAGAAEFFAHLVERHLEQIVLPLEVVVAVDADFKARIAHLPHRVGVARADVRRG